MIKMEGTEVEKAGLTKVNTFKTKRLNTCISIQTTAKKIRFTNAEKSIQLNAPWKLVEIENA